MLTKITANPFEWLFRWWAERTWNNSIIKENNTHGLNTILFSYWTKIPCVALLAPRKTYYIDIDRAKGEALVNIIIVVYLKIMIIKWNCVMLNGDGNGKRSIGTVKRATKNVQLFFATLLQNELNSGVARFTTCEIKNLATDRFERRW